MHKNWTILGVPHRVQYQKQSYLGVLCIACLPLRKLVFVSETNAENSEKVAIRSFHIGRSFNESLPLLNHRPQFVSS